jgi:uncharacterized protein (TIGR03118 family)
MRTWFRPLRPARSGQRPSPRPTLERLEGRCLPDAGGFVQTALASSVQGLAAHFDKDLINPWGFSETPDGRFRISANGAGNAPLLTARGVELGKAVNLPPPLGSPPGTTTTPNGQVVNTTSDFVISDDGRSAPATTIFSTEDGTIIGFNPKVDAREGILAADESQTGAVYKLLGSGSVGTNNYLYATDFHNNKIDVFDKNFHKVTLGTGGFGTFTDPKEPAGFAPFGIKNINGVLFVTYAVQKGPDNHDDQEGPGNGFIDEFDTSGHFLGRFATGTTAGGTLTELNSPIGMAVAPAGFGPGGKFGGALLVGNFGDSHVSAFDLKTGAFLGQLSDDEGNPLVLNGGFQGPSDKGLWGIAFGNGKNGADPNALFFASGINDEADGVFGKVTFSREDHDRDDRRHGGDDRDVMTPQGQDQGAMQPQGQAGGGTTATGGMGQDTSGHNLSSTVFGDPAAVRSLQQQLLGDLSRIEGLLASHGQDANGSQSMAGNTRTAAGMDPLTPLVSHRRVIDRLFGDFDSGSPN